ncbi:MAG: ADP-ribosylglycohydrolase family protein [Caulobacteraceae bacterium]
MLGLAVGDALGTTLEFTARDSRPLHTEMTGGGPFSLLPGVWTDDTSMALALAESLASSGGLDEHDLMNRFVRWRRHIDYSPTGECFDVGNATGESLLRFEKTGDPIAGDADPQKAGNGSLMRLSPVAIFHRGEPGNAVEAARRQSATTHAAPECLAACAYYAGLLVRAIGGEPKGQVLAPCPWPDGGAVAKIADGSWRSKTREQIRSTGYVIHSLEAALWAVGGANTFEEAIVTAVNLGEDADTVGAIAGQLAGASWGASAIPRRWLEILAWRERLEIAVDALLGLRRQGPT